MKLSPRHSMLASLLSVALYCVLACGTVPEEAEDSSPHSSADLIPEVASIRPGEAFMVGLRLRLDPGWHSYWLNPGDAGQPASIEWHTPDGFAAGEFLWPYPRKVEESSVVSYGYEDEVMLLTEITPPRTLATGRAITIAARAHWLVCANICLPAMADIEFEIDVGDGEPMPDQRWRAEFEETRRKLPAVMESWQMRAERSNDGYCLDIVAPGAALPPFDGAFFYIGERGVLDHGAAQAISEAGGAVRISLVSSPYAREEPARLRGVLVIPEAAQTEGGTARAVAVDAAISPLPRGN